MPQATGSNHVFVKHIITGGAVDQQRNRNTIKGSEPASLQLPKDFLQLPKEGDVVLAIDGSNSQKHSLCWLFIVNYTGPLTFQNFC
jgi:hypothetical protein